MVKSGIEGKFLKTIHNLYSDIKSCIFANGEQSKYFGCYTGVRQGESLSPLLMSLYVNDMQQYFLDNGCNFLGHTDFAEKSFKLLILLYADDTVIMADNPILFQKSLESLQTYCEKWKLTVSITKSKVMIFRKRKDTGKNVFYYDNQKLDIVHEFKYLGIVFNYNGTFVKHKKHVYDQGQKTMYALLRKIKLLHLPLDIQIGLFQNLVIPVLLYGCELYGYENIEIIERLQLKYLKYILGLKPSTPKRPVVTL